MEWLLDRVRCPLCSIVLLFRRHYCVFSQSRLNCRYYVRVTRTHNEETILYYVRPVRVVKTRKKNLLNRGSRKKNPPTAVIIAFRHLAIIIILDMYIIIIIFNVTVLWIADKRFDSVTNRSRTRSHASHGHTVGGSANAKVVSQLALQNRADERFVFRYL